LYGVNGFFYMKYCVIVLYFYCLVVEDDGPFFLNWRLSHSL